MSSCTGSIDDAVAAVSDTFGWTVMARVADAPTATHPDWVTSNWRQRPPGIMGDGRSSHYGEAVAWLRPTGAAEQVLGYIDAERAELDDLIAKHGRKYKLRPMLEVLRLRT